MVSGGPAGERKAVRKTVETIAQAPYANGFRHAFGIPGGEVLEFLAALRKTGIKFVLTTNKFRKAAAAALNGRRFALIEARIDPAEYHRQM